MAGLPPLKLVALTGYGRPRDREQSQRAGFDAHVIKPIDVRSLDRLLSGLYGPIASE